MKTILAVCIMMAVLAGAGYYGLPLLIERETTTLQTGMLELQKRIGAIELNIKEEKDAREKAQLPPDADVTSIINGLNDASQKISSLDAAYQESSGKTEEAFKQMKTATDESFREQSEAIAVLRSDIQSQVQKLMLDKAITDIRAHILKVKVELASKNVGSAKAEMDRIVETLKNAGEYAGQEKDSALNEMMEAMKKIKTEVDQDLPVAVNRIDLLWHELSTLRVND
jgi:hypothetical protein